MEHWLNGFRTVEYERRTRAWRALVDRSKYTVWPAFGESPAGHILLQDHGNRVSFRSIKIRKLDEGKNQTGTEAMSGPTPGLAPTSPPFPPGGSRLGRPSR